MILDKHPDQKNLTLKALGYWKPNSDPNKNLPWPFDQDVSESMSLPDPRDHVGTWEDDYVKQRIVAYVKNAPAIIHWKGWSECRFGCPAIRGGIYASALDLGSACLSDGTYVWPEGFYHYLDVHNVIPPRAFLMHVLSKPEDWLTKNAKLIKEKHGDGF